MRARFRTTLVLTMLGLGGACTYAPDFANDQLVCGAGSSCPKGYSCASDNKCWKIGETPGGTGGTDGGTPHMDASPDMPSTGDPRIGFVGTWTFTGGTLDVTCSDGSSRHDALTGDYMVIGLGTAQSTVLAQYHCPTGWMLQLSSGNTMAVATPNQKCTEMTTDTTVTPPVVTTFNWSEAAFTFTKTGATAASASGRLMGPFTGTDNTSGSCDVMFTGPMTKN
jgi:hypothetical protein